MALVKEGGNSLSEAFVEVIPTPHRGACMNVEAAVLTLTEDLNQIKVMLQQILNRQDTKDFYTTDEFAELVGLEPKTVRDYLNEGRLQGTKHRSGHGRTKRWALPHAELLRYQREGLLPGNKGDRGMQGSTRRHAA